MLSSCKTKKGLLKIRTFRNTLKKRSFIFTILFVCAFAFASQDSLAIEAGGISSNVGVWWPKSLKMAPVVIWFHGGMSSANCSKGLVAGNDLSKIFPTSIVVSASACKENHWATPQIVAVLERTLDSIAVVRKRPVEEVSLVGVSDGAVGVFFYSLNGRRHVQDRLLISSNGSLLGEPQKLASWEKYKDGRWRFLQGGSDRLYPTNLTVPWIDGFCKALKSDCDLRFDPAGEHDWSYWKDKRMEWILEAISIKKK